MTKTAGILFIQKEFDNSAISAKNYLHSKGYSVTALPIKKRSTVAYIPSFPNKLDVMAWYSHGGWDGLVFVWDGTTESPGQVSPDEPVEWVQLITYFKNR
jgi:hypothetical protein